MTLVLLYLVVLVLVAVVLFGVASLLFGRGEKLPSLPRATTATVLPATGVTREDVDAVKFTQVLRGYKTSEVDWVLDRIGSELDELRTEVATLRRAAGLDVDSDAARAQERDGVAAGHRGDGAHALPAPQDGQP